MQRLFRRIWRWIKRILGLEKALGAQKTVQETSLVLADADYEFLFMQLLEGVAHGWHEGRILKFFKKLEERGKQRYWVDWLQRFGEKVLGSSVPNQQLAVRMMRLGELAQVFSEIEQIGETSYSIGRELYFRNSADVIWEYDGPDQASASEYDGLDQALAPEPETTGTTPSVQTLSIEELYQQLQRDPGLAAQVAHQLGLETADPQAIVETLKEQFEQAQAQINSQKPPETVEEWFQMGLYHASLSDWEQAIASWDEALALEPDLAQALHNKGSALAMLGRFEEALPNFEKALAIEPHDFQIWNGKGGSLYSLRRWSEALECWERTLALKEDFYQGWYNRGCTLENMGDNDGAIESFQKALEIQPDFDLAQSKLKQLL